MSKKPNTYGGGAKTNINGLHFEQTTSLDEALTKAGYVVKDCEVFNGEHMIGMSVPQNKIYKYFLTPNGVNYSDYNSKKWHPDEAFINYDTKTAYIIEKKFQNSSGSVDEKLPSCHFKKQEYQKLFKPLGYAVEFIYIFNDWFLDHRYKDTLDYIVQMGCYYYYNVIPLSKLGL